MLSNILTLNTLCYLYFTEVTVSLLFFFFLPKSLNFLFLLSASLLDSSQEYTDSTGIDVHEFLVNTLKNNPRYETDDEQKSENELDGIELIILR